MYTSPPCSGSYSNQPSPHAMESTSSQQGMQALPTARMMQVKVLYSFDDANRTNCLARCPQPLQIQTAFLDPSTQIGIIELRTCIEAILAGSPELTSKLDHDFTVYAFDYSEYETPLVGQGMLSRILHSASPTPEAPAESSQTMVTGRVCRNVLGLFGKGGSGETLEVKLRLVPVAKAVESQYQDHMQRVREGNAHLAQSQEGEAWSEFLKSNPGMATHNASLPSPHPSMTDGRSPFTQNSPQPWAPSPSQQQYTSRPATPAQSVPHARQPSLSRPNSRASNISSAPVQVQHTAVTVSAPLDTHPNDPTYYQDGPRKRARIEQTSWRGPSSFASKPDSLRIVASTTASLRSQGPAISGGHPTAAEIAAGEIGPRPPTPVASRGSRPNLARLSFSNQERRAAYRSPYAADSEAASPSSPPRFQREDTTTSTPFDMPSSPPIMPIDDRNTPSSPQLPPMMHHLDSGFVSGSIEEDILLTEDDSRTKKTSRAERNSQLSNKRGVIMSRKRSQPDMSTDINFEMPGDPSLLPTHILPRPMRAPPKEKPPKLRTTQSAPGPSSPGLPPMLQSEPSYDFPGLPMAKSSAANQIDNANSHRESMARPRSESVAQTPFSEAPGDEPRSGRGGNSNKALKRKLNIEQKLQDSIDRGEMPKFCHNCGEIRTPSWRKCFVKVVNVPPDQVSLTEEDNEGVCVQAFQKNDNGEIISSQVIRRALGPDQGEDYEEKALCNPCGIHLNKYNTMRDAARWIAKQKEKEKEEPKAKAPKKRSKKQKLGTETSSMAAGPESDGESAYAMSDFPSGRSDRSIAKSTGRSESQPNSGRSDRSEPKSVTGARASHDFRSLSQPERSNIDKMLLERAIQSSPPRIPGSQRSPIEIDSTDKSRTPDRIRRLLFPSPRRPGEMKTLDASGTSPRPLSTQKKKKVAKAMENPFTTLPASTEADKENVEPEKIHEDDPDVDALFNGSPGFQAPATPRTPKSADRLRSEDPFKTPNRSTSAKRRGILLSVGRSGSARLLTPSRIAGLSQEIQDSPWSSQFKFMFGFDGTSQAGSNSGGSPAGAKNGAGYVLPSGIAFDETDFSGFDGEIVTEAQFAEWMDSIPENEGAVAAEKA